MVDHEQRCDYYNNENKKEAYPDSIGSLYLIVGHRTEEQSRQASCTLVRHERQPLTPLAGILQITMLDRVIELFAGAYRTNSQVSPLKMQKALALLSEFPVERQLNWHMRLSPILSVCVFAACGGKASAQSHYESSTGSANYAMKLGEDALLKIEPKVIMSSTKSVFSGGAKAPPEMIGELTRHLKGRANYYRLGHPRMTFRKVNRYARHRLQRHLRWRSHGPRYVTGPSFDGPRRRFEWGTRTISLEARHYHDDLLDRRAP